MSGRRARHALLIGSSEYQRLSDLPSCAIDIAQLGAVLRDREVGGYTTVVPLLNRTAAHVRREIEAFLDSIDAGDLALVYFTGHGLRASRTTSEFFFAAADTDPGNLELTGVRSGYVNGLLEEHSDIQRVAILDCCMSGGFVHGFRVRDEPPARGDDRPQAKGPAEGAPRGTFVLSSSGAAQLSFAGVDGPDGPAPSMYTDVVVRALRTGLSGQAERGRPISVLALQEYVQEQMRQVRPPQTPLYSALAVDGAIAIADAPRGRSAVSRPSSPPDPPGSSQPPEGGEPEVPTWPRLLAYFHDHVRSESSTPRLLDARAAGHDFVGLTGRERMISGDLDDGEMAIPDEVTQWLASREPSDELWTGYPAVLLDEGRRDGPRFAPLLVRRVEVTERNRLSPYGPVLLNRDLVEKLLDQVEVDELLDTYEPTWRGGEHGRLAVEVRRLLTDTLQMGWVEELRPDRLSACLDLNSPGEGARNAAVLFTATNGDVYTGGLRKDLAKIKEKVDEIESTALAPLRRGPASIQSSGLDPQLVSPQALNDAQREVLRSAMTNSLTVATGPPGTGKSQLVTAVIATALAAGHKVLLASTNHRAVEEVCEKFAEFAPGALVRTRPKDRSEVETDTLEALLALDPPVTGAVRTARARLHRAMGAVTDLDQELEKGARAEAMLASLATALLARASELGVDRARLCRTLQPDPSRWVERARRAADASWFADWRRRRLFRRAGLDELRADQAGCRALGAAAEALDEQRRVRPIALAQRPDELLAAELQLGARQAELVATDLVGAQVRALADSGRQKIEQLLQATAGPRSDWPALKKALAHVPAWAVTNLSVGRFPPDAGLFDLVVIDEASQCSLPSIVPLLFRARRALVIGDPKQLAPITRLDPARAARIRRQHGLSANWLEEHTMFATNSAYDAGERAVAGRALILDEHYRCHPEIAEAASTLFYRGRWTVLTDTRGRPSLGGPAVVGIDVRGEARRGSGGRSWVNEVEVERVVEQVGMVLRALPTTASIGVVSPFASQATHIGERVIKRFGPLDEDRFLSATVHKFQGAQRDVVLFSLTVGGQHTRGSMGWMVKQPALWNVAITRARSHLFVVGDLDVWRGCSRVVASLLDASSRDGGVSGPWDDHLYAALADRYGSEIRIGVPCHGYRADAVVTGPNGAVSWLVDPGPPGDTGGARHRRQLLRRCELLGGDSQMARRVPVWKLIEGEEIEPRR